MKQAAAPPVGGKTLTAVRVYVVFADVKTAPSTTLDAAVCFSGWQQIGYRRSSGARRPSGNVSPLSPRQ
jgi:hypothetical protein